MVIEVPDGIRHGETERLSDPDQAGSELPSLELF